MQISYYPSQSRPNRQRSMRQTLDLNEAQFATQAKEKRISEAISYAKASARSCARTIVVHGIPLDEHDVSCRMAGYQVNRHLREFATRCCFEYVKQLQKRQGGAK